MRYNPEKHHRRSIRLKGYDYAQPGAYFVTIVTQDRACLFGDVVDGQMRLNDAGHMVKRWWDELNRKFPHVQTDAFVVMPNHVHGIIVIEPVGADPRVCPDASGAHAGAPQQSGAHTGAPQQSGAHAGAPLPEIVQWFKTMTTNEYIRHVRNDRWTPFPGRLWQRNYYEHIIRNDESLDHIRKYIADNPLRWHLDRDNPWHIGKGDDLPV